jgi:hypothetical protein
MSEQHFSFLCCRFHKCFLRSNQCPQLRWDHLQVIDEQWNTGVLTQCLTSRQSTIFSVTNIGFAAYHHQIDETNAPRWDDHPQVIDKRWSTRVCTHFSLTREKSHPRRYRHHHHLDKTKAPGWETIVSELLTNGGGTNEFAHTSAWQERKSPSRRYRQWNCEHSWDTTRHFSFQSLLLWIEKCSRIVRHRDVICFHNVWLPISPLYM